MEAKVIIVSAQKSNRSNLMVWAVAITGEEKPKAYCKSAYKAMRFAYLLKKRTGLNISENCLARLSFEIASRKAEQEAVLREIVGDLCESHTTEEVAAQQPEEPKKKARKPRTKKAAQAVALK